MTSALVVGGTGIISTAIVRQLLARGVQVSVFNRGLRPSPAREGVRMIRGDRANASDFVLAFEGERFDVVYDMICYTAEDADASVHAFSGRCEQFVFCSSASSMAGRCRRASSSTSALHSNRPVTGGRAKSYASRHSCVPPNAGPSN